MSNCTYKYIVIMKNGTLKILERPQSQPPNRQEWQSNPGETNLSSLFLVNYKSTLITEQEMLNNSKKAKKALQFFSEKEPLFELSNFYVHSRELLFKGIKYSTSEHAYQAQKYMQAGGPEANVNFAKEIATAKSPYQAKLLANQDKCSRYNWQKPLLATINKYKELGVVRRSDWELEKLSIMREILFAKFTQDLHCKMVLLSTVGEYLEEASPHDSYWGIGKTGTGTNHLGLLLVEVRELLLLEDFVLEPF